MRCSVDQISCPVKTGLTGLVAMALYVCEFFFSPITYCCVLWYKCIYGTFFLLIKMHLVLITSLHVFA